MYRCIHVRSEHFRRISPSACPRAPGCCAPIARRRRWSKLLPLYEQAPGNPDVAINLGGAYILLRKWNKAERVLSKAAELHPDNAMIWINLGAAHLGDLELSGPQQQRRAIRAYERALSADPQAPNVHYHLGLIYKDQRNWERAAEYFALALEVNPQDRDAQRWLERLHAWHRKRRRPR